MYANHLPLIADFAAQSSHNLFRVGLFVQATINQHLEQVPLMIKTYDLKGLGYSYFMRWQKIALKNLTKEVDGLHTLLPQWKKQGEQGALGALNYCVKFYGFGIVKAAFFVQLILPGGAIGCLDRHNLNLAGLPPGVFKNTPKKPASLTQKIKMYVDTCKQLGGSEHLWNRWCDYIALRRPHIFNSAEAVSRLHVRCILGEAYAGSLD